MFEQLDLDTEIRQVTLMEDRACVQRRGSMALSVGRQRLILHGVSPVIVDKTLSVRTNSASIKIVNTRILRGRNTRGQEEQSGEQHGAKKYWFSKHLFLPLG